MIINRKVRKFTLFITRKVFWRARTRKKMISWSLAIAPYGTTVVVIV